MCATNCVFSFENGILVSPLWRSEKHTEQESEFELWRDSGQNKSPGSLVYSRALQVYRCHWEPLWYAYDFDTCEVSCVEASVETAGKLQTNGIAYAQRSLPPIPVVFAIGKSLWQLAAKR